VGLSSKTGSVAVGAITLVAIKGGLLDAVVSKELVSPFETSFDEVTSCSGFCDADLFLVGGKF